ncbi:uncharacterized protein LOC141651814 [Silene latifolia]|uniref:uncharacterized protein LOC141651814 n=1 Tax=Silene latifolia TaxID=37657 RepID=UPI003D785701
MTALKNTQNRFRPLNSVTKSALQSSKASVLQSSDEGTSKDGALITSSYTGKTKSIYSIQGIPALNLSEGELVFWGKCLPKIADLVGKYVKMDIDTHDKVRLSYAWVMVELPMDPKLPEKVKFLDESGHVKKEWRHVVKPQGMPASVLTPPTLTPTNFPPLHTVRTTPVVRSTPAKQIMRLNRQEGMVGVRLSGKFSYYTVMDALNRTATPQGQIVDNGKDPSCQYPCIRVVKWFMHNNGVGLFGLLETKLKPGTLLKRDTSIYDGWSVSTNYSWHKGGRIWILWKPNLFDIQFLSYSAQHVHMLVHSQTDGKRFYLTLIYAFNGLYERVELWNILKGISVECIEPWLWLGNFNTVLSLVERLGGNTSDAEMDHFQDCVSICGVLKLEGNRVLNVLVCGGTPPNLKDSIGKIWIREYRASMALENIQQALVDKPGDAELLQQEMDLAHDLKGLITARDSFLIQKAKVQWSLEGDLNTSYFHHAIKKIMMLNKVFQIEDKDGMICTEGDTIQEAFLGYYTDLLGPHTLTDEVNVNMVRKGACCNENHWDILARPVTAEEVKNSIFSIPKSKSPGPDGYTSQFFSDAWHVVGDEVCAAVINFFDTGKLLTQINATVITLIPRMERPTSVKHFRPISCCNVLYKAISKILCTRLAMVLPDIISKNQGAFVKGRSILENILIYQDLIRLYHRGKASPRCMFKLDLQKAYDSIEWQFVDQMLEALMFPEKTRQLIMTCISTPSYTLNLNRAQFGYFKGRRGLRQGDPISPLLFCIFMKYLTRVMDFATKKWFFRFHPLCKSLKLTHLLFADELLMFSKGDVKSIMLILQVLATFSATSGLKVNASKSEVVLNGEKIVAKVRANRGNEAQLYSRAPLVSWHGICFSKKEGGLGIKEVGVWNAATVGKLVHRLYTKAGRLWVLWINHVYLKGANWDSYQPPLDSNWNWRNICRVKGLLDGGYQGNHWIASTGGYSVGPGYQWMQGSHPPSIGIRMYGIIGFCQSILLLVG